MIKGPWPMTPDGRKHQIPLERPYLTPMFMGERVAIRVSQDDHDKLRRGLGLHGIITDLDTQKRYELRGKSCGEGREPWLIACYCDAEITEVSDTREMCAEALSILDEMRDSFMYNLSTDYHIEFVGRREERLREILATIATRVVP